MNVWVGGVDLSGDTQSFGRIAGGVAPLNVTPVNKEAFERIGGLHDGGIDAVTFFNPSAGSAHPVLSALPRTDVVLTTTIGSTLGYPAAGLTAKQVNYDGTRAADGMLTFAVQSLSNTHPLDWGVLLTAGKRTDTAATDGTSVDLTDVSTAYGWQAYLHVFSVTGTSVTVTLEDSANDADWTPLTGGAFTAVADPGPGAQRLAGASDATVRRYLRATSSGTFTEAIFGVVFTRNLVALD
jgi:hypothetical protein